jgi:hypothetical protein
MSIKVEVDTGNLTQLAEQAAEKAIRIVLEDELFAAFQESFDANAWEWPRDLPTRKLNGATLAEKAASYRKGEGITPPNPRNLIDKGSSGLRGSGTRDMVSKFEVVYTWSKEYANFVHEGGTMRPWGNKNAARVLIPARPWTRAVLGQERVSGIEPFDVGKRLRDVWMVYFRP